MPAKSYREAIFLQINLPKLLNSKKLANSYGLSNFEKGYLVFSPLKTKILLLGHELLVLYKRDVSL